MTDLFHLHPLLLESLLDETLFWFQSPSQHRIQQYNLLVWVPLGLLCITIIHSSPLNSL